MRLVVKPWLLLSMRLAVTYIQCHLNVLALLLHNIQKGLIREMRALFLDQGPML